MSALVRRNSSVPTSFGGTSCGFGSSEEQVGTLTIAGIEAISVPGRYIDGDGLMLRVTESGSENWILRVRIEGERRDVGLGSFKVVTLAEAREKAREYRRLIAQGVDPVAEKKKVVDSVPRLCQSNLAAVRVAG